MIFETIKGILDYYDQIFISKTVKKLKKLDIVLIPNQNIENELRDETFWGLMLFNEKRFSFYQKNTTPQQKQQIDLFLANQFAKLVIIMIYYNSFRRLDHLKIYFI